MVEYSKCPSAGSKRSSWKFFVDSLHAPRAVEQSFPEDHRPSAAARHHPAALQNAHNGVPNWRIIQSGEQVIRLAAGKINKIGAANALGKNLILRASPVDHRQGFDPSRTQAGEMACPQVGPIRNTFGAFGAGRSRQADDVRRSGQAAQQVAVDRFHGRQILTAADQRQLAAARNLDF